MSGFSFHLLILTKTLFRTQHVFSHKNTTLLWLEPLSISLITTYSKIWKTQPISSYTCNLGYAHIQTILLPLTGIIKIHFVLLLFPQTTMFQLVLRRVHCNPPTVTFVTGDKRTPTGEMTRSCLELVVIFTGMTGMVLLGSIYCSGRHWWKLQGNLQFFLYV